MLTNFREPDLMALWNMAVALDKARFRFAPPALVQRLEQVPASSLTELYLSMLTGKETTTEHIAAMQKVMAQHQKVTQERHEILRAIDSHVMNLLRGRELRCFAFEHPRTFRAPPVELLPEHWTVLPNWETGEFRHAGLHLIELRLLPAADAAAIPASDAPAAPGRPSFKTEILDAYTALQAQGGFTTKPLTVGIGQIRTWIRMHRPQSRAAQGLLGDDTIRNVIKPLLGKGEPQRS